MQNIQDGSFLNKFIKFINCKESLFAQIVKFAVVGGISFFIDAGILYLLTELFDVKYYLLFSGISFTVSVVINYILSMRFVFDGKEDLNKHSEFIIFVVLSIIGLGINQLVMWLLGELISRYVLLTSVYVLAVKIIATFIVMVWNFISRKIFLEKH